MNVHFYGSQFYLGEFYFAAPLPIVTIDKHDGFDRKFRKKAHDKEDREDISKTLREAIYGPAVADPVVALPETEITAKAYDDDEESITMLLLA